MDKMINEKLFWLSDYSQVPKQVVEDYTNRLIDHITNVKKAGERIGVNNHQLAIHDDSKWIPDEFIPYANHFCGDGDKEGFSKAWLSHIHRNPHHWQHWIFPDAFNLPDTTMENNIVRMPDKYALEMVADWMGAGLTYSGKDDMTEWLSTHMPTINLHTQTAAFVVNTLNTLGYDHVTNKHAFNTI